MAVQIPAGIHEDVQDADGLTAQREGVLGARRDEAPAEHARNSVEFIGQAENLAHIGLRQFVTGKTGLVLFRKGFGDVFSFAVDHGVFLAHDALQFCKFHDHLRSQVGLSQQGRPLQGFVRQAEV